MLGQHEDNLLQRPHYMHMPKCLCFFFYTCNMQYISISFHIYRQTQSKVQFRLSKCETYSLFPPLLGNVKYTVIFILIQRNGDGEKWHFMGVGIYLVINMLDDQRKTYTNYIWVSNIFVLNVYCMFHLLDNAFMFHP